MSYTVFQSWCIFKTQYSTVAVWCIGDAEFWCISTVIQLVGVSPLRGTSCRDRDRRVQLVQDITELRAKTTQHEETT